MSKVHGASQGSNTAATREVLSAIRMTPIPIAPMFLLALIRAL
jgi:hypothetical protein